jgi:hypothetical protein
MKRILLFSFSLFLLSGFCSCDKEDDTEDKTSTFTSDDSHETGNNCMVCHKSGGPGEGIFAVGGTVYDSSGTVPYPGATIKLFSGSNGSGSLASTLQVDKLGNFYTTSGVSFGSGLFPSVQGPTQTRYMSFSVTTGACNSCHGVTTDPIKAY